MVVFVCGEIHNGRLRECSLWRGTRDCVSREV